MKKKWLVTALLFCLVSMIGSALVMSHLGQETLTTIRTKTTIGELTGYLIVPDGVTSDNPAPAIVVSHGVDSSAEMMDAYYGELARRGFVVFAVNLYGHGDTPQPDSQFQETISYKTNGIYDSVEYLSTLSIVDDQKIGLVGHSLGGGSVLDTATYYSEQEEAALAANQTATEPKKANKVAAVLSVGFPIGSIGTASYGKAFTGLNSDLGLILGKYDDFQAWLTHDILGRPEAKDWLKGQTGLTTVPTSIEEGHFYRGETPYTFALWNPGDIHTGNLVSFSATSGVIDFFEETLGAPKPLKSSNQIWWLKQGFHLLGLIGVLMFIFPAMSGLLTLPIFSGLKGSMKQLPALEGTSKRRYYLLNSLISIVNAILVIPLMLVGMLGMVNQIWPQSITSSFGLWSFVGGLITLLVLRFGFKVKLLPRDNSTISLSVKALITTLSLAILTVGLSYGLVFAAKFLLNTDFRFWTVALRPFNSEKLFIWLRYLPLFFVYHFANSLSLTRNNFANWSEKRRTITSIIFGVAPILLLIVITYLPIPFIGHTMWSGSGTNLLMLAAGNVTISLLPMVPMLTMITLINLKAQKLTGSIWLGTFINTMFFTMMMVANCSIQM